jgi:hypothetical protein
MSLGSRCQACLNMPYNAAKEQVAVALKDEGFGVNGGARPAETRHREE